MRFKTSLLFLSALVAVRSPAQSTLGTIIVSVGDASGAAVAGAALTLRNLDENISSTGSSSAQGLFEFPNLQAGRYLVIAEKPGFAVSTAPEFRLDARETRRVEFILQIAPRADTAIVSAIVPRINTENGTIADSKNWEQITRLPLNFRASLNNSPLQTILSVPGVQQDRGGRLSIGGGLPAQVDISIDGISAVNVSANLPNPRLSPSAEMIGEFRVTSVGNTAEFGQMGDVTMVTRGGTNQDHGSLFWYHQNRALDAIIYNAPAKQAKVFNTFGGSYSGPLRVPGYDGHNRTFLFADFEGNRRPQTQLDQFAVPVLSARTGILTNLPGGPALDPSTGAPFPDNRILPASINSVASKLLSNYYPLPNVPDNGSGINYRRLTAVNDTLNGYDLRLDHHLRPAQHLFVRWTDKYETQLGDNGLLPGDTYATNYRNLVVSFVSSPRASISNEFRFGFAIFDFVTRPAFAGKDAVANLGITGLDLSNVGNSGGFPGFYFDGTTGYTSIGEGRSTRNQSRTFQYVDTLSWIHGRHISKFGAEVRRIGTRQTLHGGDGNDDFGAFEFDGGVFTGNAFADLLLGLPSYSYYAALGPNISETSTVFSAFAQDSWQVARRFTLQAGLRWEVHPPFHEQSGNIANFDHRTGDVIIPDHSLPPAPAFLAAIGACAGTNTQPCTKVLTASQAGLGQSLRKTYFGNWNPRLGFAWQPWADRKTVVRGAIGGYTQALLGFFAYAMTGVATSDIRTFTNDQGPHQPPAFRLPAATPPLSSLGLIGTEAFFDGTDPTIKDPRSWQWDFTMEREMPWRSAFRATYTGVQTAGLAVRTDFNQVRASTTPFSVSRQPFAQWGNLISLQGLGFANYQGMTLEWSRRMRGDLFFNASYTLSKNVGETGTATGPFFAPENPSFVLTDRFNTRYDRGDLTGARRNRFLLTGLFPLPFGRGRAFGGNLHGLAQGILGGWELSTVSLIQSGPYQTPTIAASLDRSNTNIAFRAAARPDRIGNGNLSNPTPDQYYDRTAFAAAPAGAGRFGNAGAGILQGPGTVAIAAGLAKSFRISERLRLRTEATFTNLPNHPNFLPPNVNFSSPAFGRLNAVQSAENSGNRSGQLGARLDF